MPINLETLPYGTELEMSDGSLAVVAGPAGRNRGWTNLRFPEGTMLQHWPPNGVFIYEHNGTVVNPTGDPAEYPAVVGLVGGGELPDIPERLPFDPFQPIELDDGTPCRIVEYNPIRLAWAWVVRLDDDNGDLGPKGSTFWFTRNGGFSPDSFPHRPRLVNVDPSVPQHVKDARHAFRQADESEKPDWLDEDWFKPHADLHFPLLVDENDAAMVSFFENERKLEAGRRTTMRVGRYVRRFSGGKLKDEDVERVAAASDVKLRGNRVKITQDADEIERIYVNGPRSCMAHGADSYDTDGIHPTRVYAGPDLGIAYLGEIYDASARCVVWPDRKLYGTIYGDVSRMRRMLENMGFEEGSMNGARVRLIECDYGIVMPYVDDAGDGRVDYVEKVVVLGAGHDVETGNTNGLGSDEDSVVCELCEARVSTDATTTVETDRYTEQTWCHFCAVHEATYCDSYGASVADCCVVEVNGPHGTDGRPNWALDDYVEVACGDRCGELWHVDCTAEDAEGNVWHIDELPDADAEAPASKPPLATQAELEAAGQMRLPLTVAGQFRCLLDGYTECGLWADPRKKHGTFEEAEETRRQLSRLYPRCAYTVEPVPALEALAIAA